MQIIEALINPILELIAPKTAPGSSIFIILVAVFTSVISTVISRKFIDIKKLKLYTKKTKEHQRLQRKALRSQDPVLKKKLENQSSTNKRMQSELAKMRLKPMLYTMLPMILIFFSLSSYYSTNASNTDTLVGNIPFSLPENFIFFKVGINCPDARTSALIQYNTLDIEDIKTQNENLENPKDLSELLLCLNNPNLLYVPTYIGWYIFVNVIINGIITKFSGLSPD